MVDGLTQFIRTHNQSAPLPFPPTGGPTCMSLPANLRVSVMATLLYPRATPREAASLAAASAATAASRAPSLTAMEPTLAAPEEEEGAVGSEEEERGGASPLPEAAPDASGAAGG